MKYRKKPVVIEAIQWTRENELILSEWLFKKDEFDKVDWSLTTDDKGKVIIDKITIKTLEGVMEASIGDYIIKGVNGEFYPCKPDIFEKTYEVVEDENN